MARNELKKLKQVPSCITVCDICFRMLVVISFFVVCSDGGHSVTVVDLLHIM